MRLGYGADSQKPRSLLFGNPGTRWRGEVDPQQSSRTRVIANVPVRCMPATRMAVARAAVQSSLLEGRLMSELSAVADVYHWCTLAFRRLRTTRHRLNENQRQAPFGTASRPALPRSLQAAYSEDRNHTSRLGTCRTFRF